MATDELKVSKRNAQFEQRETLIANRKAAPCRRVLVLVQPVRPIDQALENGVHHERRPGTDGRKVRPYQAGGEAEKLRLNPE